MYSDNGPLRQENLRKELFQDRLAIVLSPQITGRNIDSFAHEALNSLINLINQAINEYTKLQNCPSTDNRKLEDQAFAHFGLQNIEEILDLIADKIDHLDTINNHINAIPIRQHVITPPDEANNIITTGNGEFKEKEIMSRLKLLYYILLNDYAIKPTDTAAEKGIVTSQMMRQESYATVVVPTLNRIIQVCDEEGNISFVFNHRLIEAAGLSVQDLNDMTKQDKKLLIRESPELGTILQYSEYWRQHMSMLLSKETNFTDLNNTVRSQESDKKESSETSLPIIDDELSPNRGFVEIDGQIYGTLAAIANRINIDIEELTKYLTNTSAKSVKEKALNNQSKEITVYRLLAAENHFLIEDAPEGYLSIRGIAKNYGTTPKTILKAIERLGDCLGEVSVFRVKNNVTAAYTPIQQELIEEWLEQNGYFTDNAPEGYLSISGVAKNLGTARLTILKAIEDLGDSLGEVRKYKFGNETVIGYSFHQQKMIKEWLEDNGYFTEDAPEGYLSAWGIAKKYGCSQRATRKSLQALGTSIGEVRKYKFGNEIVIGYSLRQQKMIKEWLEDKHFTEDAPEGYLSAWGIAKKYGCSQGAIRKSIQALGTSLGEKRKCRFNTKYANAYSPEQQELIKEWLEDNGYFTEDAPEGYLSIKGMAYRIGTDKAKIKKYINELSDSLGEVRKYKFYSKFTYGYSPKQQEIIRNYINNKKQK